MARSLNLLNGGSSQRRIFQDRLSIGGEPLSVELGAPLRLRVENQLGYKMVKWIRSIEFVESIDDLGKGFGGKNEDEEYYDLLADS